MSPVTPRENRTIALTLVDNMRRKYHACGSLPGWLPISDGIRAGMVARTDTHDSAQAVKMAAYVWGHQPG
jgi:hypothetical protein